MPPETTVQPKQRATKQEDVSAEFGVQAWRYTDGSIRGEGGKLLKRLEGGADAITPQTAREMHQKRQELTARKLADAIAATTSGHLKLNVGAPEAVAAAGGILWKDIVLGGDPNAYPRDRIQAFDVLTQRARLLEPKQPAQADTVTVRHELAVSPEVLALLRGARDEVIDAEVTSDE